MKKKFNIDVTISLREKKGIKETTELQVTRPSDAFHSFMAIIKAASFLTIYHVTSITSNELIQIQNLLLKMKRKCSVFLVL